MKKVKKSVRKSKKTKVVTLEPLAPEVINEGCSDFTTEDRKAMGRTLTADDRATAKRHYECLHKKGGLFDRENKYPSNGSSNQYSVIKHQHMNGDIWVRCIRCGKNWKPPVRSQYPVDRDWYKALFEYEEAVAFPTQNTMSGSIQFQFSMNRSRVQGNEVVRENMASTN